LTGLNGNANPLDADEPTLRIKLLSGVTNSLIAPRLHGIGCSSAERRNAQTSITSTSTD
jgi:hypothetical protein